MSRPRPSRYNTFHGPKQQVLGSKAGHVAPAWRGAGPSAMNGVAGSSQARQITNPGSKILLSKLPTDVTEKEVDELFKKTVGPLKDSFIVYNSQANSKGMAVVHFQNVGDAAVAKAKYDGKYIDGRRPIKIEIIVEDTSTFRSLSAPVATSGPSLLARLDKGRGPPTAPAARPPTTINHNLPRQAAAAAQIVAGVAPPTGPRRRVKKGPKRVKKIQHAAVSVEQLDQEMEDYRASNPTS